MKITRDYETENMFLRAELEVIETERDTLRTENQRLRWECNNLPPEERELCQGCSLPMEYKRMKEALEYYADESKWERRDVQWSKKMLRYAKCSKRKE